MIRLLPRKKKKTGGGEKKTIYSHARPKKRTTAEKRKLGKSTINKR